MGTLGGMRAAFVVAVADQGASLPPHVLRLLSSPQRPPHLNFTPAAHRFWSSTDGRTALGAWQELPAEQRTCWTTQPGGIAVVCGMPRVIGSPWRPRQEWPQVIAELLDVEGRGAPDPTTVAGLWIGAAIADDGHGMIVNDPFATRPIHHARGAHRTVISSNPHLAAFAAAEEGRTPARDAPGVCAIAMTGQRFVRHSGYTGVEPFRPGHYIVLRPGTRPEIVERRAIWWPPDSYFEAGRDELIDLAADGVSEAVGAARTFPARLLVADLTGGRDSRLVLAGALLAGITDDLVFKTAGPPTLPDVVVARELAARYGLRHVRSSGLRRIRQERGIPTTQRARSAAAGWREAARTYIDAAAATDNIMQVKVKESAAEEADEVLLNGLMGESLRSFATWPVTTEE